MALRMWASSTANALRVSCPTRIPLSLPFSLSRCFSTVLEELKYASSHEWVKLEGSVATIGITDHPQINSSPYEEGWMIKVKPSNPSELGSLMGPKEYTKHCEEEDASH